MSIAVGLAPGVELATCTYRVTRSDLVRYAGASGDLNPIHWSDRVAERAGLPGVVAHGMLVMALAGEAVRTWTGDPLALSSFGFRFTRPLVVPDEGAATLEVLGRVDEGNTLVITVRAADSTVLGRARATIGAADLD